MLAGLRFGGAFLALTCVTLGLNSNRATAITVEVARKCKALTDKAYPPREPGNPAAGSSKGGGRAEQDYFNKCVANHGTMDDRAPRQAK